MRVSLSLLGVALLASCASASNMALDGSRRAPSDSMDFRRSLRPSKSLYAPPSKRSPATDDVQQSIVNLADTDPVAAAIAAQGLDGIKGNTDGGDLADNTLIQGDSESAENPQDNQYSWNYNVPFLPNADATPGQGGEDAQGWTALPQLGGFELRREVIRDGATLPFYITQDYDANSIKKAVIVMPGKPRDSWKYTNLVRNAMNAALTNHPEYGLTNGSILVIGPAWLNQYDQQFGAATNTDLVFHGSQWQSGGNSRSPSLNHSITTYECLDWFADWLMNKSNFPNMNGVTFAGHSMGGQAVARYAILKKQKSYDDNISYWIGNPGSWAWLDDTRPTQNASCTDYDEWHYGIGANQTKITKYARKDVIADKSAVVARYKTRKVHYGLGLLDNGPGDTHCEAVMQGGNHLDRGCNFIQQLGNLQGGFPTGVQTANFIANASHQDYAMISANSTLQHLFKDGYDTRQPDIVASNPGDKKKEDEPAVDPNPPPRAFATPVHKLISYGLLGGTIGATVLIFAILPFLFPNNAQPWEQQQWEADSKRALM